MHNMSIIYHNCILVYNRMFIHFTFFVILSSFPEGAGACDAVNAPE